MRFVLQSPRYAVETLILLVACLQIVRAADPYAAALDRRFRTGTTPTEAPDSGVAALEAGVRAQALELSQPPEPSPPPAADGFEQCWLWALGVAGTFGAGLGSLIALRRWNQGLDQPGSKLARSKTVMAEDPSMAAFLWALDERAQTSPVAATSGTTGSPDPVFGLTAGGQAPADLVPSERSLASVREHLAVLRTAFPQLSQTLDNVERLRILRQLLEQVDLVKESSLAPALRPLWLLACAVRGFLTQLSGNAAHVTPSALRTTAAALDLLELLCARSYRPDLATEPPIRLLAVDDDPVSRWALAIAIRKSFPEPQLAADGPSALAFATQRRYDAIFLDVEMPDMDGFELCSKIHETVPNRTTPVVFVTSHSDFDSRTKGALLGAHDLISKPFLAFDITVKALTLVLIARLEKDDSKPAFSEGDLPRATTPAQDTAKVPTASALVRPAPSGCQIPTPSESPKRDANQVNMTAKSRSNPGEAPSIPGPALGRGPGTSPKLDDANLADQPPHSSVEFEKAFMKNAPAHLQLLHQTP